MALHFSYDENRAVYALIPVAFASSTGTQKGAWDYVDEMLVPTIRKLGVTKQEEMAVSDELCHFSS